MSARLSQAPAEGTIGRLSVAGPFELAQALAFLNGFAPAGAADQDTVYREAHALNGRALLVEVLASEPGALRIQVQGPHAGPTDVPAAEALVRRVFSLDVDAAAFYGRVGANDPVIGGLQARYPGLRPVLFGSPFEALCWAIIGQRISIAQAARLKARLAARFGPLVTVGERTWQAFPAPEDLLRMDPARDAQEVGLPRLKLERLWALAERGSAGDLAPERLRAMAPDEARG